MKTNCWEFLRCGREPDGEKVAELGICPAATATEHDGKNGGVNGGRYCWRIPDTFCGDTVDTKAAKVLMCSKCDFFMEVQDDLGASITM